MYKLFDLPYIKLFTFCEHFLKELANHTKKKQGDKKIPSFCTQAGEERKMAILLAFCTALEKKERFYGDRKERDYVF